MTGTPKLGDAAVSSREAEVLACLGEHLTYPEIGARLYISERTVESHVGSLRRKLGVEDRRALVRLSAERRALRAGSTLTTPASSFVGRAAERSGLTDAVDGARLVSVVGPGGIGKTRLAIAVAAGLGDRFERVWYADLVPVADVSAVPSAVLRAVGLTEVPAATTDQTLVAGIGHRPGLLVVDNCEHVLDGVATLVEHLLSRCSQLHVLLTSRVRLATPLEHVFALPELTLADAVELFTTRAVSAGGPGRDRPEGRVARICVALDQLPLAIELAAARVPSLGVDGVEAALAPAHRFALLTGGSRTDERHRSLQSTLDWSHQLLSPRHQAVFRRISVFASTFTADAAAIVAGFAPVDPGDVWAILGDLVDHHLLSPVGDGEATRYRVLETLREYGAQRLGSDDTPTRDRHIDWCIDTATELDSPDAGAAPDTAAWRAAVDRVADEMRAAVAWAAPRGEPAGVQRLATLLAGLLFRRGRPTDAQQCYQQAADLSDDDPTAVAAFAAAAAVAKCRVRGEDALRLEQAAVDAATAAGDRVGTALALGRIVELYTRWQGMFATPPSRQATEDLLAEARALAEPGDPAVDVALAAADAFLADADRAEPLCRAAVEQARTAGSPLLESAALDVLAVAQIKRGDIAAAAAISRQRVEFLVRHRRPIEPPTALELKDALHMAVKTSIALGDLPGARRHARHQRALPFLGTEDDLANEESLAPTALAGDWDQTLPAAERFLDVWRSAGSPAAPGRSMAPAAVAMVHGLRGDDDARAEWLAAFATMHGVSPHEHPRGTGYGDVFDAIVLLHQNRPTEARTVLAPDPDTIGRIFGSLFRQWYLALRAEAAVLDQADDAQLALTQAKAATTGNPIATAITTRAAGLRHHDRDALHAAADAFRQAACPYQWARTLVLAGGTSREQGRLALTQLGATPIEP